MIEVKAEDFEQYRARLLRYAEGLLYSKGSARTLWEECKESAKDIVQNTYLVFHDCNKNVFVTEAHLFSFLKIVLYKKYQESVDPNRRIVQYTLFKEFDESINEEKGKYKHNHPITKFHDEFDTLEKFKKDLNNIESDILISLLKGESGAEIGKRLNMSRQNINLKLKKIREKYKSYESKSI